ncbi:MAG TPA: hypothetical protein VH369_07600, partial [Bryobacteraceae bacterium]
RLLCQMQHLNVQQVWQRIDEGLPKLWTIYHGLRVRREHPQCFDQTGRYTPLLVKGSRSEHAIAYLRGKNVLVLVPRLVWKLAGDWGDTALEIPLGTWRNELTGTLVEGGSVPIADLLETFPAALLISGTGYEITKSNQGML